jgi:hypothetical protein
MLRRLSCLPLFAVLLLRVALADSIPPRELGREVRLSSANTKALGANFSNGFGRSEPQFDGRQKSRLPRRLISVPLGDGSQTYGPYGSQVRPRKSFIDLLLDAFVTDKYREKRKH